VFFVFVSSFVFNRFPCLFLWGEDYARRDKVVFNWMHGVYGYANSLRNEH
jgi:hypothetical protein